MTLPSIGKKISYRLNKLLKNSVSPARWDDKGIKASFYSTNLKYGKQIGI